MASCKKRKGDGESFVSCKKGVYTAVVCCSPRTIDSKYSKNNLIELTYEFPDCPKYRECPPTSFSERVKLPKILDTRFYVNSQKKDKFTFVSPTATPAVTGEKLIMGASRFKRSDITGSVPANLTLTNLLYTEKMFAVKDFTRQSPGRSGIYRTANEGTAPAVGPQAPDTALSSSTYQSDDGNVIKTEPVCQLYAPEVYLRIYQEKDQFEFDTGQHYRFEIDYEISSIKAEEYFLYNNRDLWKDFIDTFQTLNIVSGNASDSIEVYANQGVVTINEQEPE